MKIPSHFAIAALAFAGLCATAGAQDAPAKKEKLVEFKDIKVGVQKTPDFTLRGTTDKRWKQKDWLEIEPEFKTERPAGGDRTAEVIPELTFKYWVFLNSATKENARVLTTTVTHTNVPIDEVSHSVAYISPSTILKVTGKQEGNLGLVTYYAVEVTQGSNVVGFFSKGPKGTSKDPSDKAGRWWEAPSAPKSDEGGLLSKPETPFAPLWGDYHADVKPK